MRPVLLCEGAIWGADATEQGECETVQAEGIETDKGFDENGDEIRVGLEMLDELGEHRQRIGVDQRDELTARRLHVVDGNAGEQLARGMMGCQVGQHE